MERDTLKISKRPRNVKHFTHLPPSDVAAITLSKQLLEKERMSVGRNRESDPAWLQAAPTSIASPAGNACLLRVRQPGTAQDQAARRRCTSSELPTQTNEWPILLTAERIRKGSSG